MTTTASRADMNGIIDSLGLKSCKYIIANPDRKNIFYEKIFRRGQDFDAIQSILMPIAKGLLEEKNEYPLTVVYVPLRLCGFAYKLFEYVLGVEQYFPVGSLPIPSNRLFGQFHAQQTDQMKEEILKQLCSKCSIIRVVFATVAIGMGVDIPDIRQVIHVVPPCSMKAYFKRQVVLDEMAIHRQHAYFTIIKTLVKTEWLCMMTCVTFAQAMTYASGNYY